MPPSFVQMAKMLDVLESILNLHVHDSRHGSQYPHAVAHSLCCVPLLLFAQMAKMLDVLESFLNLHAHTYMRLDGSTKPEQRQILMQVRACLSDGATDAINI